MNEIREYNESTRFTNEDKIQFAFRIEKNQSSKVRKEDFQKDLKSGLSMFYSVMHREKVMKVSPLDEVDFPDNKKGEYEKQTIVGFPFRIGVIREETEIDVRFRMGIKVQRFDVI